MNLKVRHRDDKTPKLDLTFPQFISAFSSYLSSIYFTIFVPSTRRCLKGYFSLKFSNKNLYAFVVLHVRSTCFACHIFLFFNHEPNICCWAHIMKLLITSFPISQPLRSDQSLPITLNLFMLKYVSQMVCFILPKKQVIVTWITHGQTWTRVKDAFEWRTYTFSKCVLCDSAYLVELWRSFVADTNPLLQS
jgi:hypothetical protein